MPVLECECNGSILRREFSVSENGLNAGYASIQPIFGKTQHSTHFRKLGPSQAPAVHLCYLKYSIDTLKHKLLILQCLRGAEISIGVYGVWEFQVRSLGRRQGGYQRRFPQFHPNNVQFASAHGCRMCDKRAARCAQGPVDEGDPSKWHPQTQYEHLITWLSRPVMGKKVICREATMPYAGN